MSRIFHPRTLVLLCVLCALCVSLPFFTGCRSLNQRPDVPLEEGGPHATSAEFDYKLAIVTNHERLQQFINWEAANPSVAIRLPQVHQLANAIAADLPAKFREANQLFLAYQSIPPGPDNGDRLARARRALDAGLAVLVAYVKQANLAQLRASIP